MNDLNTLFAALVVDRHNMSMLHWGSKGKGFDTYHGIASEYEDQLTDFLDDVAEIIMMTTTSPKRVPSLIECIDILKTSDDSYAMLGTDKGDLEFDRESFISSVKIIFAQLIKLYDDVTDSSYGLSGDIVSKLQEHQYWIRKELGYKLQRR